jgi:hypothetical protein
MFVCTLFIVMNLWLKPLLCPDLFLSSQIIVNLLSFILTIWGQNELSSHGTAAGPQVAIQVGIKDCRTTGRPTSRNTERTGELQI